jgi:hypothetical protein
MQKIISIVNSGYKIEARKRKKDERREKGKRRVG